MKFRTYYDNFGEVEHKNIDDEVFTEPSMTDTSPASFEPIDVKVARILRGEIVPHEPVYFEVDEKMSLEDAFDTEDPTDSDMFDLADATEISEALRDDIIRREQQSKHSEQQEKKAEDSNGQGQANEVSANEADAVDAV